MLVTKLIINALLFIHLYAVVRASGFEKSTNVDSAHCGTRISSSNSSIKNVDEAIKVCQILENNVKIYSKKSVCPEITDYLSFFRLEENKEQLYQGLKNYSGNNHFDAFSKYAYITLLKEQYFYDKLHLFIGKDIKKLYQNNFGELNNITLLFVKEEFQHSENFTLKELDEFFLRYVSAMIIREFIYYYKNIEVIFTTFSFVIYDQINNFFSDGIRQCNINYFTNQTLQYLHSLYRKGSKKFDDSRKIKVHYFMSKINDYYETKFNKYIDARENDMICEINNSILQENDEFKICLSNLCKANEENIIFKEINLTLTKRSELCEKIAKRPKFAVKNNDIILFFELCIKNKSLETICCYVEFGYDILKIKGFYRSADLTQDDLFVIGDQMFGIFIISTIILHHQENGKCSYIDVQRVQRAWNVMESNFENNTTESFLGFFRLYESYFRLMIKHLNYEIINYFLKSMQMHDITNKMLVDITFGKYYTQNQKKTIEEILNTIVYNSTDYSGLVAATGSGEKLLAPLKKIKTRKCYKAFENKIHNADEQVLSSSKSSKSEIDENQHAANETMKKVNSFCEILQKLKILENDLELKREAQYQMEDFDDSDISKT